MILLNDTPVEIEKGEYVLVTTMTAGTTALSLSIDGLDFVDIPSGSWTESTTKYIVLPSCQLKALLTGDAELAIKDVKSSLR